MNRTIHRSGAVNPWTLAAIALVVVIVVLVGLYMAYRPVDAEEGLAARQAAYDSLAERVQRAVRRGESTTVLAATEAFTAEHDQFAPGYRLLGQVYVGISEQGPGEGYLEKALAAWNRSLALDPQQPGLYQLAGDVALEVNQPGLAEKHFRAGAKLSPGNPVYIVRLAVALAEQGQLDEAQTMVLRVLKAQSDNYEAYYALSVVHFKKGNHRLAVQDIDYALKHLRAQDQADQRRDLLVKYVRRKARVLLHLNEPEEALRVLTDDRVLQPMERRQFEVVEELARCYGHPGLNRPDQAAEQFEAEIRSSPLDWRWAARACHWRIVAGDVVRARELLEKLKQMKAELGRDVALAERIEELSARIEAIPGGGGGPGQGEGN